VVLSLFAIYIIQDINYVEHKEYFKEYFKKRYEDNKDKIKIQSLQKLTCNCGKTFGIYKKTRHEKSQYHKDYLKQQDQEYSC